MHRSKYHWQNYFGPNTALDTNTVTRSQASLRRGCSVLGVSVGQDMPAGEQEGKVTFRQTPFLPGSVVWWPVTSGLQDFFITVHSHSMQGFVAPRFVKPAFQASVASGTTEFRKRQVGDPGNTSGDVLTEAAACRMLREMLENRQINRTLTRAG